MTVELASAARHTLGGVEFAALYAQAQSFYGQQMRILDAHDTAAWAATFTDDALLELPSLSGPLPARSGLALWTREKAAARRLAGDRLAHWIGVLTVRPQADATLRTRCSALVYAVPPGAESKALHVCVMEDVLTREREDTWRIAHRRVTRDDLA
ncbi:nuclear transport factor 2 family protein [Streptomyces sp. NPDC102406]|uniref:nuclear transport factor 2 family protein n=1 Tax=Streptomyces sp. NPDC102406 TaxID=3366171 RepID=UPI0037F3AEA9